MSGKARSNLEAFFKSLKVVESRPSSPVDEQVHALKKIISKAIKNYRNRAIENRNNANTITSFVVEKLTSLLFSPPALTFIEEEYLCKLEILIDESKSSEEVLYTFGSFYHYLLPFTRCIEPNALIENYSFIAFFLEELRVEKIYPTKDDIFLSFLEERIRRQALNTPANTNHLAHFNFSLSLNYHADVSKHARKKCLDALLMFNNTEMVDKFKKTLENNEEFVMVDPEDLSKKCNKMESTTTSQCF